LAHVDALVCTAVREDSVIDADDDVTEGDRAEAQATGKG
jgi:hypothetical protein